MSSARTLTKRLPFRLSNQPHKIPILIYGTLRLNSIARTTAASRACHPPSTSRRFIHLTKLRLSSSDSPTSPYQPPARGKETALNSHNVLGDVPVPVTSVETCLPDGFKLKSEIIVDQGDGVLLFGGEALRWRPWVSGSKSARKLLNDKGQWDVPVEAFKIFEGLWPRPGKFSCPKTHKEVVSCEGVE